AAPKVRRMKTASTRFALSALLLLARADVAVADRLTQVWQADIQIRTLEVTRSKSTMTARIVVFTEKDDEAREARLVILLPLGVGIDRLTPGCAATAGPSMVPA